MTFAVRYFTQTGNTKRLAEAIAEELGVEALPIDTPISEKVDVLLLGNSYYAFTIAPEVGAFVSGLSKDKVGKIIAAMMKSTYKKVRSVANTVGIPVLDKEFHCKGEFKGMNKGRPNEDDLKAAKEFARNIKKELG